MLHTYLGSTWCKAGRLSSLLDMCVDLSNILMNVCKSITYFIWWLSEFFYHCLRFIWVTFTLCSIYLHTCTLVLNHFPFRSASFGFFASNTRVARFFLIQTKPNWENKTKWPQTITNGQKSYQNGSKIFQIVIKYANIFHSKALQNLPKLVFLVLK
jgi:hypothetical protein